MSDVADAGGGDGGRGAAGARRAAERTAVSVETARFIELQHP
jgi:hypothetical protein